MQTREAVILFICVAAAHGIPSKQGTGRIVGGTPAARGEFPWHVSIQVPVTIGANPEFEHKCDGTIITDEFILTDWFCDLYSESSSVRVVAGTLNWTAPGSTHNVTQIFPEDVSGYHYLSLWKIDPAFAFGPDVGSVGLPAESTESLPGTNVTASGWGESPPGTTSDVLVKLESPIVSKAECGSSYPGLGTSYLICARGGDTGLGFCSHRGYGAPLVYEGELRGVFTLAPFPCDLPAVFTEVSLFRAWISRVIGI